MRDLTNNHEAMNRLQVYSLARIDYYTEKPSAYIAECRARRLVRKHYEVFKKEIEKSLGYNLPLEKYEDKILRSDDHFVVSFLEEYDKSGFVSATLSFIKRRVGIKKIR